MTKTKKTVISGLCIAIGILLPMLFHSIPGAGGIFLPMHLPILICGLVCGWPYGLACGLIAPLLSHLFTGMPPAPVLPGMMIELAVYGVAAGLLIRYLRTKNETAKLFIAMVGAMLAGRVAGGLMNALIFQEGKYTLTAWLTASFVTGLPGIAIQLILIPAVILALRKTKMIPAQR